NGRRFLDSCGSRFKVQGSRFRGSRFKVLVQGSGSRFWFKVQFKVTGSWFHVRGRGAPCHTRGKRRASIRSGQLRCDSVPRRGALVGQGDHGRWGLVVEPGGEHQRDGRSIDECGPDRDGGVAGQVGQAQARGEGGRQEDVVV